MNYALHYQRLIEKAPKTRLKGVYLEKHHIKPRCLCEDITCNGYKKERKHTCGLDGPENIVYLKPEEHFVAHQLLVKIYKNTSNYYKMVLAATMMCSKTGERVNNKKFGWLKRENSKVMSMLKSDRFVSEETKKKQSESRIGFVVSEETKKKISKTRKELIAHGLIENSFKGKHHTKQTKKALSEMQSGKNNFYFNKKRPDHSAKMKIIMTGKNKWTSGSKWCHNPITLETKMVTGKIPNGFVAGRPFKKRKPRTEEFKSHMSKITRERHAATKY